MMARFLESYCVRLGSCRARGGNSIILYASPTPIEGGWEFEKCLTLGSAGQNQSPYLATPLTLAGEGWGVDQRGSSVNSL